MLALTVVGGIVRLWAPQHLGLVHFDEGIYALAGLWPFHRGGLASLDPTVIAYAPPGFPFLVGLSYMVFGVSDVAATLVSVVTGTLTIPLAAWLARRTFGAGAGAAAAAFVALSGFHVAFSRMALTDASFLFCWTLGLICGQRFLERPGLLTALALGASTGLAQLFKYNGWLIGAFVILAAVVGLLFDPRERTRAQLAAVWGWGALAALFAWVIYWPWFQFVEAHGGYVRLMAHHQSYVGGPESWLPHLRLQVDQMGALAGGPVWVAVGAVAAYIAAGSVFGLSHLIAPARLGLLATFTAITVKLPHLFWWIVGMGLPRAGTGQGPSKRMLGVAWIGLSLLTPFYHPYARLWLPLLLIGTVVLAGYLSFELSEASPEHCAVPPTPDRARLIRQGLRLGWFLVVFYAVIASDWNPRFIPGPGKNPGPLAATDSLRSAVQEVLHDVPKDVLGLRLLVRPPVTFYLAGRLAVQTEPDVASLMKPGSPGFWVLFDTAQLPIGSDRNDALARLLERWEVEEPYETELNLPTLLDVDPSAARAGRSETVSAPLLLLRPRNAGPSP